MKRIFLTSGLVLCMACPAFATNPTGFPIGTGQGEYTAETLADGETVAGACVNDVIGTFANNTTLKAKWEAVFGVMALNENDGALTANGGASTGTTYDATGTNDSLFLTPYNSTSREGVGVYKRTGSNTAQSPYVFTQLASGDQAISAPTGIDVTYNRTDTLPSGASTSVTTASTSSTENRTFLGYYLNGTTNDTIDNDSSSQTWNQTIAADGKITGKGVSAALTYDNDTPWVALYKLVSPTVTGPAAYGYHFNGWHVDGASAVTPTASLPGNIGQNTALVADWSPVQYTITYNCGGDNYGTAPSPQTATFDVAGSWATNNDSATGTQNCHRDGYHFTGWTCTAALAAGGNSTLVSNGGTSCGGVDHKNPASCTGSAFGGTDGKWQYAALAANGTTGAAVSCTAQWAENTITITWNKNNAESADIPNNTCTYTGSVSVPATPTRTGYEFKGWEVVSE